MNNRNFRKSIIMILVIPFFSAVFFISWNGLEVSNGTVTRLHANYQGKTDVLQITPGGNGYNDMILIYNLREYSGQRITIEVSMEIWLDSPTKIVWQINNDDWPLIAGDYGRTFEAKRWHTIRGSSTVSIGQNKMLFLSSAQFGNTSAYIVGFSVKVNGQVISKKPETDSGASIDWDKKPWVDPAAQTTSLKGGTVLNPPHGGPNGLPGSPYNYEIFDYGGPNTVNNKMIWYGPNAGGGGAFKVEWSGYILARLGFFWGNGGVYTQYKNIYVDYNFTRSANNTAPSGGFIGVYGWSRNPSAAKPVERLIEFYIVDDWFTNAAPGPQQIFQTYTKTQIREKGETLNSDLGPYTERGNNITFGEELGSFEVDGAVYKLYRGTRVKEGCIDYPPDYLGTFTQLFSVRQNRRTSGTISVTEHFKAWSKYIELGNLFEVKFKVESMNFTSTQRNGFLDLSYLYLSQETNRRNIQTGTEPVDAGRR